MPTMTVKAWMAASLCLLSTWSAPADDRVANVDQVFQQTDGGFTPPAPQVTSGTVCAPNACAANGCGNNYTFQSLSNATSYFCDTCSSSRFQPFVGVEATYLKPNIHGGASSATVNGTSSGSTQAEGFYAGPRIWAGLRDCNSPLFVQVQYWQLNGNDVRALNGPTFGASTGTLSVQTFDFEVGSIFHIDSICTDGLVTFGGRHVEWNTSSQVAGSQLQAIDQFSSATATGLSSFSGTGLTFSYQLKRQIACTNWSLFASNRYSWIWGEDNNSAISSASAFSPGANSGSINGALGSGSSQLWIAEFQVGTQWQRRLQCINANAFVRIAFEYQFWDANSNSQATAGSFAVAGPPPVSSSAIASSGPLGMSLYGVALSTGLTW
ncbi:hypothetical protein [Schlesneria paludicola]|uniref:hypothetical protein n=1 Tax=Schlesneria paludicola TaxID=360056 RepID=UPI00029ACFBC|nr:hypothetical protein [Schlesneria paludicola]